MFSADTALHVHDTGRFVLDDDSSEQTCRRYRGKAAIRARCKNALREHPFLPKEITDRIISFAGSFGLKVILVAKAGKLIYSSRPVRDMIARCCIFYADADGLKVGLAIYRKGKISLFDSKCASHVKWLRCFSVHYEKLAKEIQYAVLNKVIEPLVVPGLFLKSSNVKYC